MNGFERIESEIAQGGKIYIVAGCDVTTEGRITSKGTDPGAELVHLEGCAVLVRGLVESTGKAHTVNAREFSDRVENNKEMFHCPSDRQYLGEEATYFDREGLSYEYPSSRLGKKTREQVRTSRRGDDRSSTRVWIVYDFEAVDGPEGEDGSRNFLYLDGHVDALILAED